MRVAKKLIYASAAVILGCIVTKLWLFDIILKYIIRDQTALKKKNEVRDIYLKTPFPLSFKVYLFNVSNPMEIQNGAKPILNEVGPYWYDEFKEKIDIVEIKMEDSLTYTPYDIYKFNQNKSGLLKEDDYVTILHPLMVGLVYQVIRDSPVFLSIINQSLPSIFQNPKSIFLTGKVKDILFDGIEINCKSQAFAPNAVCLQMKTQIPGLKFKKEDQKIYLFSLLGWKNATSTTRVKVLRGISQSKDLGKLVELDGEKKLTIWGSKQCNRFDGTDGWIFPPLLTPEEGLKSFSMDLCRNMKLSYINDTVLKKMNVRIYETDLGDQSTDENEKCFCRTSDSCLKKGVFDLSKCRGVPIFATLPHFLHTDESYLENVEGLRPETDKHSLRVHFEPLTGSPVKATLRMQFNMDLKPNKKLFLFANIPDALFPLFWVEEGIDLEGDLLKKLQGTFLLLTIGNSIIYIFLGFGIFSMGMAVYFYQKNKKDITITPIYEAKKNENIEYENNDIQHLTRRGDTKKEMGHTNPVMSGHEFDKY